MFNNIEPSGRWGLFEPPVYVPGKIWKGYQPAKTIWWVVSLTGEKEDWRPLSDRQREIAIAIPVISFGGIVAGVLLQLAGVIPDAAQFWYGPAIGAFLLGYLAWLKPRFDIVSIFAPVYALLILIFPLETQPGLLIVILFAVSITILDIRLVKKFSTPSPFAMEDPMEQYLYEYIERLRTSYQDIDRKTAHEVAQAFLSFRYGLYGNAVKEADEAIPFARWHRAQKSVAEGALTDAGPGV